VHDNRSRFIRLTLSVTLSMWLTGCSDARGPYADNASQPRDVVKAEERYQAAVTQLAEKTPDDEKTEKLLREALGFDLYHGAAHNNLGVLLLRKDRLYDAAEEFEWARKLLPGHPEPRVNLAIALDRGGKHQEALEAARAALEVRPGNLPAIKTIAVIQLREAQTDDLTRGYLDTIIQRSNDPQWKDWAERNKLALEARNPLTR
jgi:tetratricopeptide (TPR) repeat protein